MDAVEEINGTYFNHGHTNVVPGEWFDQSVIEQLADALGMTAEAVSMILIGSRSSRYQGNYTPPL